MKPQPLLFLGKRRREALEARLAAGARRWRQAWTEEGVEGFEAACEPPSAAGFTSPVAMVATSAWQLNRAGECIAVLLLPHATFAWMVQQGGAVDSVAMAEGSLGERLEREVARSLLLEVGGVDAHQAADVTRSSPDELREWSRNARAWTMTLRATHGRSCTLLLSSAGVEMLAPARAPVDAPPLGARREAVGENTVRLRAVIGETRIPVGELAGLALDDVLVLDQPLSEPVSLVCGHAALTVAAANLGRSGARRAVKIINRGNS
jgi:flagellar motor switch/type III secretory pathway protein FliN